MSFLSSLFGYSDDAGTYAANVSAQWRALQAARTEPPTQAWINAYETFVRNYGVPTGDIEEFAAAQYNAAIGDAVIDGFAEAPGIVADYIREGGDSLFTGTLGTLWRGIPVTVRIVGGCALVFLAYRAARDADLVPAITTLLRKK